MIVMHNGAHLSALGISSSFLLALPNAASEAGSRFPYVLCLHDDGCNGETMLRSLNCEEMVDACRCALLHPNGQNSCFLDMTHGPAWQNYLLMGLLPLAERSFPLSGKPSLLGMGTGGWAASRLAQQLPDRFFASAAVDAQPDLQEQYTQGKLCTKPDLQAAFGDPVQMKKYPLCPDTKWFCGEGAAQKALQYVMHADRSARL